MHGTFFPVARCTRMTSLWLVANSNSGMTDDQRIEEIGARIAGSGFDLVRVIDLAETDLPDMGEFPDIVASLGGDGTANAVIDRYCDIPGIALLILPGGTMNLLAARLHGDADAEEIIERAARAPPMVTLPRVEGPGFHSLAGVIAGATTHWGEVRENIREGDLTTLLESVPAALEETFEGARVRVEGHVGDHAALFVDPRRDGLSVHAIHAESLGDLAAHGWAWLNRDFLGGPTEELMQGNEIVLEQDGGTVTMLVDGERHALPSPLRLRAGQCPARFIATKES